ncbi:hypothetical protein B0F90DRAFT_405898 [Multifurca ochricompacta]|uniref:Uncharacterized protein n=1 Tax=Multifurca ochricompacta TaxID=376703 RepID=A0AAD4LUV1_9AGAM|nr:hypothetical protein B0F90DRAFT_405898 [Multifurca ochricompacta]
MTSARGAHNIVSTPLVIEQSARSIGTIGIVIQHVSTLFDFIVSHGLLYDLGPWSTVLIGSISHHSATTPTSPSMVSLQSGITNIDYGVGTPVTPVARDNQESILGALPPSLVQEDEEEQFVTPPGSPGDNLMALPLTTISSRRPSPVARQSTW